MQILLKLFRHYAVNASNMIEFYRDGAKNFAEE
jgi:hypothetical protein